MFIKACRVFLFLLGLEPIKGFLPPFPRQQSTHSTMMKAYYSEDGPKMKRSLHPAQEIPFHDSPEEIEIFHHSDLRFIMEARKNQRSPYCPLPLHLHIGAGKLGLGLLVPAIAKSGTPLAIVQRPSEAFDLLNTNLIDIKVNDEMVCEGMQVIRDFRDLPDTISSNLLVLSEDPLLLNILVNTATSYSMSLGPHMKSIIPLLSTLPVADKADECCPARVLYAGENDHAMVAEVAEALKNRVRVCSVMVDRICTSRSVDGGSGSTIEVSCEPFEGEMVVHLEPSFIPNTPVPFGGDNVRLPQKEKQAQYFYKRKLLLVNGVHSTLAFLTLCLRQPMDRRSTVEYTEPENHLLISCDVKNCGGELYKEIWAWAVARVLMLSNEFELDVLLEAHKVSSIEALVDDLLSYAKDTLQRFSSTSDTTSRVLNGGIANRYQTRLKIVETSLDNVSRNHSFQTSLILKKAGLTLPYIQKVVSRLCADSRRFTGLKPEGSKISSEIEVTSVGTVGNNNNILMGTA